MLSSAAVVLTVTMICGQTEKTKVTVPKEVLVFFEQFVGEWKMEGTSLDGPMSGTNIWKWAKGRHCLTYETLWTDKKGTARAFAVCGWDPQKEQLVETEYWTSNGINTLRYTKRNATLWEGTMAGVTSEGKTISGNVAYEFKSPTHIIFRATDGNGSGQPGNGIELHYRKIPSQEGSKANEKGAVKRK